jgi:periplasmic divalent cation tolerance protein
MPTEPTDAIAVFITPSSSEEAGRLAEMLINKRLAACVQILPEMDSVFCWEGKVERQREVLLIAKTLHSKFAELEKEVGALHSYETPEIVAVPLVAGAAAYLQWLSASVTELAQQSN